MDLLFPLTDVAKGASHYTPFELWI